MCYVVLNGEASGFAPMTTKEVVMNVLFVYVIGTAVALGLIDLIATKWVEWHAVLDDDEPESYVCQYCDYFNVATETAICRACVIDRYGIDPDPTGEHWEILNPGKKP